MIKGDRYTMPLTKEERRLLLSLARKAIKAIIEGKDIHDVEPETSSLSPTLKKKMGVFVTLHKNQELRGCIGYILPMLPLWQAVMENARNAAFRDPRFPPLGPKELGQVDIEISVLTPPREISDISEFRVGTDGIILKKGPYQAVFLPQVATEQGWDRETTMRYLSMKAGLDPEAWRRDARFETFQAEVFSESDY